MKLDVSPSATENSPSTLTVLRPLAYLVLALVVVGMLLLSILGTGRAPGVVINIFSTRFLGIFIEAAPFLLLGSLTSGLIAAFVRPEDVTRVMPRSPILSTIGGAFLGLIFPVCECGVVPVTRRLFKKGLPMSVGIAFLLAAPFMNPIVFVSTFIAFGFGPVFIGRFLLTAIVAISVGLIFALNAKPDQVLLPISRHDDDPDSSRAPRPTVRQGLAESLNVAVDDFFEMGRFLVMGCVLAASMQTLVSQDVLLSVGSEPVISVLAMQALAFVLSVCSTVDAFLALAFVNTFTTGSILAFLSFGPMVDIKSTMMFTGVFKRRVVAYLILLPFLMNLLAGVLINYWLT